MLALKCTAWELRHVVYEFYADILQITNGTGALTLRFLFHWFRGFLLANQSPRHFQSLYYLLRNFALLFTNSYVKSNQFS